jgi:hypothetical protein
MMTSTRTLGFVALLAYGTACGSDAAKSADESESGPLTGDAAALPSDSTGAQNTDTGGTSGQNLDAAPPVSGPTSPGDAAISPTTQDSAADTGDAALPQPVVDAGVNMSVSPDEQLGLDFCKKFRECSGLDNGELNADYCKINDGYDRCVATCVMQAQCADVGRWFCGGDALQGKGPVYACASKCPIRPTDGFACKDGSFIPKSFVCDASRVLDCPGKEDELNCDLSFQCASGGPRLPMRLVCDGERACPDGSDEPERCTLCK